MKMSPEVALEKYESIKNFLYTSEELSDEQKEALKKLFNYLDNETPWLTSFSSTRFHNSFEQGNLQHSINVVNTAMGMLSYLNKTLPTPLKLTDVVLAALLHDVGKSYEYERKEPTPRQKQYGYPGSMGMNTSIPYMTHEDRSLWMVSQYYPYLSEEVWDAIANHNEPHLTNDTQFKRRPLGTLISYADYWACIYIDEPGESY